MEIVTSVGTRSNFFEILNQVQYGKKRVIVSRRQKPCVAVIPLEDLKILENASANSNASRYLKFLNTYPDFECEPFSKHITFSNGSFEWKPYNGKCLEECIDKIIKNHAVDIAPW